MTPEERAELMNLGGNRIKGARSQLRKHIAAEIRAAIDEALGELEEWAVNLRHSDDAKINWDHPGNSQRERFYKNMVAHSWIQAGQKMAQEIARRRAALRGGLCSSRRSIRQRRRRRPVPMKSS